jgi:cell wall-associated NlpC family hydrolase
VLALALVMAGTAYAEEVAPDSGSEPSATSSPSPEPTPQPTPAPEPAPVPSPSTPVTPVTPTDPPAPPVPPGIPTTEPTPTPAPSSSLATVPRSGAPEVGVPAPADRVAVSDPSDGVAPVDGQVDAYLELSAQRAQAEARIAAQRATVDASTAALVALESDRAVAAARAVLLRSASERAVDVVQDVARDLYQQGDAGLGALATALTSGPDGLLERLDNIRNVRRAATSVVVEVEQIKLEAARAEAQLAAAETAIAQATARHTQLVRDLAAATVELAEIDAELAEIGSVPPQTVIGPDGCPVENVPGTLRDGADVIGAAALCRSAVKQAATPQAALAITWAFSRLGSAYACGGAGRMLPWRMDCSSFVSRAYAEGAGLRTAGDTWAPSTRNMLPWDGVSLDPHYAYVAPQALRAGDLVLYDTCPGGGCPYRHVVMYLGSPDGGKSFWMAHTNACGDVAKVERFWGFPTTGRPFQVARRVIALPGETVSAPADRTAPPTASAAPGSIPR